MFFRFISYLKFLRHSTNQHDVHSPFVYNYVTNCLYQKPRKSKKKCLNVLLKSIEYFKFKKVKIQENDEYKSKIKLQFSNLIWDSSKIDLIYFKSTKYINPSELLKNIEISNETLLFFDNIYRSPEEHFYWKNFVHWTKATVTIDLYYCGLVFLRKEQAKEHFTIRI